VGLEETYALLLHLLSGLTFLLGGMVAYVASLDLDVRWLVPLAAGNFLYIGASDLVSEVNKSHSFGTNVVHFAAFTAGLGQLLSNASAGGH
jgi:zinc and cadmium transporter